MIVHPPAAAFEPGGEAGRQLAGGFNVVQLGAFERLAEQNRIIIG
jgi:hypothetical protein